MKYTRKDVAIGANINGWIITSDVFCEKKNDKYKYYVEAICQECKENRKVSVYNMLNGKSKRCSYCGKCHKKYTNHYQTFGNYTLLIIEEIEKKERYSFVFDTKLKSKIEKHYWNIIKTGTQTYARASDKRSSKNTNLERLHRFICELEYGEETIKDKVIDHKNRNTFDNRLDNLNIVTPLENAQNASIRKDNTSGVKGVNWSKKRNKWQARIQFNNKRIGEFFDTFEEAVKWRKEMEKNLHKYVEENYKNN